MTSAQERKAARQAQRISRSRSEVPSPSRTGGRLDVQGGGDPAARNDSTLLEDALDVGFAPIRGVANAAQDIYGLADTLLLDSLPDQTDPWLGESKTRAGALVSGASNFLTGFIPVVGWVGKGAKIGKSMTVRRTGRATSF